MVLSKTDLFLPPGEVPHASHMEPCLHYDTRFVPGKLALPLWAAVSSGEMSLSPTTLNEMESQAPGL